MIHFLRGMILAVFFSFVGSLVFFALAATHPTEPAPTWVHWLLMLCGSVVGWTLNDTGCRCRR